MKLIAKKNTRDDTWTVMITVSVTTVRYLWVATIPATSAWLAILLQR